MIDEARMRAFLIEIRGKRQGNRLETVAEEHPEELREALAERLIYKHTLEHPSQRGEEVSLVQVRLTSLGTRRLLQRAKREAAGRGAELRAVAEAR